MAHINLEGIHPQLDPMRGIGEVMRDWEDGCLTNKEALNIIYAINHEWQH